MTSTTTSNVVSMENKKSPKRKRPASKKAAAKATGEKPKKKRISVAEKFMSSKELQEAFCDKYPICTGKFRRSENPPTPSHSVQAQVKLPDGSMHWVYKQDVFQATKKASK